MSKEALTKWGILFLLATIVGLVAWRTGDPAAAAQEGPRRATDETEVLPDASLAFGREAAATAPAAGQGPLLGVAFMSSVEDPADAQQYANALSTGARWNRWPLYWSGVETVRGEYYWPAVDAAVQADIAHGLRLNVILLGTPCFYREDRCALQPALPARPAGTLQLEAAETATPDGLYEPVFTDGSGNRSDVPGPGKVINPDNVWARFVYTTVQRYRPGGVLADLHGWGPGVGVRHWEMWNEPDLEMFWDGTPQAYARLLKVGYLAAKQADPEAQILFGGLAYFEEDRFLETVLAQYAADPLAPAHGYFHDIVAVHNYFHAWSSWWYVYRTERILTAYGLEKEIWLNETGMPAWNDYPGPTWDPRSAYRGTLTEQADFVIQSAFYGTFAGADALFHFQLYDGCGNQAAGTDFPPHDGSLCTADGRLVTNPDVACAGDAFGMYRNPGDAVCFRQHPEPETPRPLVTAFRLLAQEFQGVAPLWRLRPDRTDLYHGAGAQEWIAFYRPETRERVLGMWMRFGWEETAAVPAIGSGARVIWADGTVEQRAPVNGVYTLTLRAATNQNAPWDRELYAVGGPPVLLIEKDETAPSVAAPTAHSVVANALFVRWDGDDGLGSGGVLFDVTVAVDNGPVKPWLTGTTLKEALYPVEWGRQYTFNVAARDLAGNRSVIRAVTVVATEPAGVIYLPLLME